MNHKITKLIKHIVLSLVGLFSISPFLLILITSIKSKKDALASPPKWIFTPTAENYIEQILNKSVIHAISNSLIITIGTTLLAAVIGIFAGYALARISFKGRSMLQGMILSLRMIPPVTFVIPYFIILSTMGWLDNHLSMIIMYLTISLPLITWMMQSFFMDIPKELEEAAAIDGCSRMKALRLVLLPAVAPGIFASCALTFIYVWNEFLFALYNTGSKTRTLPIEIYNSLGYYSLNWGKMSATAIVAILPAILFIGFAQKYIVTGLTMGAVKE